MAEEEWTEVEVKGAICQDDGSLGEDGLVDFYQFDDKWEFLERRKPLL